MPLLYVVLTFAGAYTLIEITDNISNMIFFWEFVVFAVSALVFAYGLCSLIRDFTDGGIRRVIDNLRK